MDRRICVEWKRPRLSALTLIQLGFSPVKHTQYARDHLIRLCPSNVPLHLWGEESAIPGYVPELAI